MNALEISATPAKREVRASVEDTKRKKKTRTLRKSTLPCPHCFQPVQ